MGKKHNYRTYRNINQYYEILSLYHSGRFGNEHLRLLQILQRAGKADLLDQMINDEILYLAEHSVGMISHMFMQIYQRKQQKTEIKIL